jgi:hypothetical protein
MQFFLVLPLDPGSESGSTKPLIPDLMLAHNTGHSQPNGIYLSLLSHFMFLLFLQ